MSKEQFAALYAAMSMREEFPAKDVMYDGTDTISVRVRIFMCSGIFINVLNDEDEDDWNTCIELKDASGRLWERHLADLEGQKQYVDEFVRKYVGQG